MNTDVSESVKLSEEIVNSLRNFALDVQVLVCPPFTNLVLVKEVVKNSKVMLGAQNCYYEKSGAYTGEISLDMLNSVGCDYVIIGHSERRTYFFETNELINKKAIAALNSNIKPIICIGETLDQRKNGETFDILTTQINNCLKNISVTQFEDVVIAYEPVWAIGTGISATVEQIEEAHKFIRALLLNLYPSKASKTIIQYGGSVSDKNADEILSIQDVNGALIGGASLKSQVFLSIINSAQKYI